MFEQLGRKKIHGAHLDQFQRPETDLKATHRWLVQGRLKGQDRGCGRGGPMWYPKDQYVQGRGAGNAWDHSV